jgi:hypothetical protein
MNTLGSVLDALLETLETDARIMLAVEPMLADIANTIACIFFCERLLRSLNLIVLFPVFFPLLAFGLELPPGLSAAF